MTGVGLELQRGLRHHLSGRVDQAARRVDIDLQEGAVPFAIVLAAARIGQIVGQQHLEFALAQQVQRRFAVVGGGDLEAVAPERGGQPLARGEVDLVSITFREGLTIAEMAAVFESHGLGTAADFRAAASDSALVADLDPTAVDLEGYLFPETYQFIEKVRTHYGITIETMFPDAAAVQRLVHEKGLFSFYQDGHSECCGIRKVEPLGRVLASCRAWVTGQRRDQSSTRSEVALFGRDDKPGLHGGPLYKLNPLAAMRSAEVWETIRAFEVPYNPLHERGMVSIGCEPCTRAILPGQHEREGRWWWEQADHKECGLHLPGGDASS